METAEGFSSYLNSNQYHLVLHTKGFNIKSHDKFIFEVIFGFYWLSYEIDCCHLSIYVVFCVLRRPLAFLHTLWALLCAPFSTNSLRPVNQRCAPKYFSSLPSWPVHRFFGTDGGVQGYGQLVLLPTSTESTRTFSLVNSYFFATRTLVNLYFFFGQLVLFFGQLVLFLWSTCTF